MAESRISSQKILDITNDYYYNYATIEWHNLQIDISKTLSGFEAEDFAKAVVESCFNEDGNYTPFEREYAERLYTIEFYTNIDMPEKYSDRYNVLFRTDLYNCVCSEINKEQYLYINEAIDEMIRYKLNNDAEELKKQTAEFFDHIKELATALGDLFDGVTQEDVSNLFDAVADTTIDESKTVELYKKINADNISESEVNGEN